MNVLFKVKKEIAAEFISLHKESKICKISSKNVVAFSTNEANDDFFLQNVIFVCDLLSPWQVYKVCATKDCVSVLEWSFTGDLLLVAEGCFVNLWKCQDQILSSWSLAFTVNLKCEKVINCSFFQNGKKMHFNAKKKDSSLFSEKFEKVALTPTLKKFGKVAEEGCIALTASGLLAVFCIPHMHHGYTLDDPFGSQSIELPVVTHSLGLVRQNVACSAIAHSPNGNFRIATTTSESLDKVVHCFNVQVNYNNGNLFVSSEALPNIFLCGGYSAGIKNKNFLITHIVWTIIDNEELVLVAYNFEHGSIIEQWNLITKHQQVHKFFQKNKAEVFQTEYWENTARYQLPTALNNICLSKNTLDSQLIHLVLKENTVQILEAGLKKVGSLNVSNLLEDIKSDIVAIDVSFMNHMLILLDNYGQMYGVQVSNRYIDLKHNELLSMQVSLLEYCIISGFDASDIILSNLNNLDSLIEKLTDNFMRQPPFVRQYYYSNFLSLKSNLCRMYGKQNDFDNLIILHSISIAFKSLLRPSDLASHDKGPADNLSIVLSDALPDVDKVLFNLDAKDYTVEPMTLQSLQQLIQWVADLTLNIFKKLPEDVIKNKCYKKLCYELSKDSSALTNLRELLAMIRIWGLLNSQCLPFYTKSVENVDVLAILFRLLTRLAQNPIEPDDALLDECLVLSTQVLIPEYNFFNQPSIISGHMMAKSFPLVFTAGVDVVAQFSDITLERVIHHNGTKDGVSNILLGCNLKRLKECTRCGFFNVLNNVAKTSATKAWCQRWINCRCGGYWKSS